MPKQPQQNPGPKEPDSTITPPLPEQRQVVWLVLAWSSVLVPLGWGILKTLQKAALLLQQ